MTRVNITHAYTEESSFICNDNFGMCLKYAVTN